MTYTIQDYSDVYRLGAKDEQERIVELLQKQDVVSWAGFNFTAINLITKGETVSTPIKEVLEEVAAQGAVAGSMTTKVEVLELMSEILDSPKFKAWSALDVMTYLRDQLKKKWGIEND